MGGLANVSYRVKLSQEKTFADCSLVPPKDATHPNILEKTFTNSYKTSKFAKVSPSKVSCYTVTGTTLVYTLHSELMKRVGHV